MMQTGKMPPDKKKEVLVFYSPREIITAGFAFRLGITIVVAIDSKEAS